MRRFALVMITVACLMGLGAPLAVPKPVTAQAGGTPMSATLFTNRINTTANPGHFIGLRLLQDGANRDAVGAWVDVRCGDTVVGREVTVGGGHASGKTGWWHFGLGEQAQTEIRVLWPDGESGDWQKVAADGFYVVERGAPPRAWTPGEGL